MHVHMQPGSPRFSFSVTTSTPWPGWCSAQIWTQLNIFGIISKGSSTSSVPDQQQPHNCSRPSSRLGATFPGQQLTDSSIPWDADARLSLTPMEVICHTDCLQVHVLSNRTVNYRMSKCFVRWMFCANFSSFCCNMHSRWLSQNWIKPALERNLHFFCCSVYKCLYTITLLCNNVLTLLSFLIVWQCVFYQFWCLTICPFAIFMVWYPPWGNYWFTGC